MNRRTGRSDDGPIHARARDLTVRHLGRRKRLAAASVQALAAGGYDLPVELVRVLGNALLRLVVDVHQAEALLVPVGPLEVVEDRPGEVARHRQPFAQGAPELEQRAVHEVDPLRIVDLTVEEDLVTRRETDL